MLKSIPTVLFFLLIYFYLKLMLFTPLDRVLQQRDALTDGARRAADESLAEAERKQEEYEKKFNEARAEVYRSQEELRRQWMDQQAEQIEEARKSGEAKVRAAKEQMSAETGRAREDLAVPSAALAEEISQTLLARRARSAG